MLIRGNNDLLLRFVKFIKGIEKFFLGGDLTDNKLDIVDQKNVNASVLILKVNTLVMLECIDQFVRKLLGSDIEDFQVRSCLHNVVADGMHQVSLAQAGSSVKEKRIIAGVSR